MTDLVVEFDALLLAAGRTEAFASIAVQLYDDARMPDERVPYLLGAVVESAAAVVAAVHRLGALVADRQPAEASDDWDDGGERGTR